MKHIIHAIAKPLVYNFNKSIETGNVPTKLKIAKNIPVYKKGDSHLLKKLSSNLYITMFL